MYRGFWLWEARSVVFYEGLRFREARFVMFYESLRLWGVQLLTKLSGFVSAGEPAEEKPSRACGDLS